MIFTGKPKNEKWETIQARQRRNDVIFGILSVPIMYVWVVLMCVL